MEKPEEDAVVETMVLVPGNIPDYCKRTGADEDEIMEQYRLATSQNKVLHAFIARYPWFMDGVAIEEDDGSPDSE